MANELVPQGRRPGGEDTPAHPSNGHSNGTPPASQKKIFDPLTAVGYVDTDEETAGEEWNLPPAEVPWEGFEVARQARRAAQKAEEDAAWARKRGLSGFATMREMDAGDNTQHGWGDWGDLRTWAIIFAMFFGFLLFVAFVYFSPTGRHNQNDGPLSVPPARFY